MDAMLPIIAFSVIVGAVIALVIFGTYFRKRKSEIQSISKPETLKTDPKPALKPSAAKKTHHKSHSHSHAADKDANKKHHPLDLNTLKGHGDAVTSLSFSPDARSLATACGDGVVRVFRLDDASSKSFKFLRINLPAGGHPTAVAFADDASSVVVATQALSGSSLYMYGEEKPKTTGEQKQQSKLPLPEIKWEHHKVHDKRAIITLVATKATYGSADGSTMIASCSEGTDIILWHGKTGKVLGHTDTNQLKNTMATISPNGRFIAAAAFTADVKVWEIVYSKDGSVKEILNVMQLKGHKSAVTWLCFSPNSEEIITASKDGSIRKWNINVRYHMDEDPKTLKVLPIPLHDANGTTLHYDRMSLSPDGKILAATHGSTLQWLCAETGEVLDTAEKAHDGDITDMAWAPTTVPIGIEVKPGKPITHSCEEARGRLRISQATLGIGGATKRTIVQCNVGNKSPVLLCVLLPNKTESCHLDLEFDEGVDVVFSVIGPRSVFLTGYYVNRSRQSNLQSDTESYGVDIENTQTDGSSYCSDDDKYDDSFIDDDDELQVSPKSPVLSSKGVDEVMMENNKPKDRKRRGKQLKKKYRVIESDNDVNSHESEDEVGHALPVFKSRRAVKTMSDAEEKIARVLVEMGDDAKDDAVCGSESKQKFEPLDIDGMLERATRAFFGDGESTEDSNEKSKLPEEVETHEENIVSSKEALTGDTVNESNGEDQMQSLDITKPKKKRKEQSMKEEKTFEVQTDNREHSAVREDKEHEVQASTDLEIGANDLLNPSELGSANGQKSKKRKNGSQLEEPHAEGIDEKCHHVHKDDNVEQGSLHVDTVTRDLPTANREDEEQLRLEEACTEQIGTTCHNVPEEYKTVQGLQLSDSMQEDLPAANGEYQEQQIDNNTSTNTELPANECQPEKKTKKKMKQTQGASDLNMNVSELTVNQEMTPMNFEDQTTLAVPVQKRTLSNGLIIEELASGPPGRKVAALGKKVKLYYTGMLKETGHVFDSNVGKTAFKFRLGDEEYIDGWNVGIEGMHVGDKRRLIIPPSMGFGDHGVGDDVPPDSWLVYDIELVGVRR
ncbi:Peptidyl-prolyl cis-trans isomerase FKBP43 [Sesamum alatum]|uniref:peptidylprolyl isomerase n=1 Tax=Sesamum alatum TaxID=300844 RepID=A0AAE1XVG9_9LAMI|nr:Peptidyl-prolyl cis-trans isomerase FKBP43 [Sesamum alatum]